MSLENNTPIEQPQAAENVDNKTAAKDIKLNLKEYLKSVFNLNLDKENDFRTIDTIKADVDFRGTKLWILICAIFIASLGLNVNSTAVIIGAMLISPLMGPIIGLGLAIGISDLELLKRSARNYAVSTLISIFTATLYFLISPLGHAQSELLARTQPTIYDVLIAFFGGIAGILASTAKNKGNVLPGVAIATALMPPLCTAGFGLASANWAFFFGAFYLYMINSVFIAIATYLIVRAMRFPRKAMTDKKREKTVRKVFTFVAILTILPSFWLGFQLVRDSYTRESAARFIQEELNTNTTQVIKSEILKSGDIYIIDVVLLGRQLTKEEIDKIVKKMPQYGLKKVKLNIKQALDKQEVNVNELKSIVLQDFYEDSRRIISEQQRTIDSLKETLGKYRGYIELNKRINSEAKALFPEVRNITIAPTPEFVVGQDSVLLIVISKNGKLAPADKNKLSEWLKKSTNTKYTRIVLEN